MNLPFALEALIAVLLVLAGGFAFVGAFGLFKLKDFYKRLHGPTKATTLGVGGVLIAAMLYLGYESFTSNPVLSLRELLITLFAFLTAPISAHLLMKATLHLDPGARPPEPKGDVHVD